MTIWTIYVSSTSATAALIESSQPATLLTSIFPERDAECCISTAEQPCSDRSICNSPFGYGSGRSLFSLMSLEEFVNGGGDEVPNAKILVVVSAVGETSTCTSASSVHLRLPSDVNEVLNLHHSHPNKAIQKPQSASTSTTKPAKLPSQSLNPSSPPPEHGTPIKPASSSPPRKHFPTTPSP